MRGRTYEEYRSIMMLARVAPVSEDAWNRAQGQRPPEPEMIRCDCGHSVPRTQVMSASRGTVCPDCYDRYSD